MVPMSVEEIAKAVDGRLIGDAGSESRATNTVSDSRQAGPGSVFVAIRGERVDGHDFVAKTAGQGATVAIVDHEVKSDGLPQIVVKDTVDALGELARYNIVRRRELDGDFDIIGLTGSVGKTTTKDLLSSLLATVGPTVAPVGSFNNEIGLPLTALRVDEHTRFFVAEMGASATDPYRTAEHGNRIEGRRRSPWRIRLPRTHRTGEKRDRAGIASRRHRGTERR